ncbi:MAG: hypothetical protein ACOYXN_00550 [Acidobacteriota bacterium]
MRKALLLLFMAALALPALGQPMPCTVGGSARLEVLGPEDPTNLWQQAGYVSFWLSSDATVAVGGSQGALHYANGHFSSCLSGVANTSWPGGVCPDEGAEIVGAVLYWSDENTLDQRAFFAVGTLLASASVAEGTCTMREVPEPTATVDAGIVTLTWSAPPEAAAGLVTGYQLQRSADGISFANVGSVVTAPTTTDTPGPGTWHYALKLRFKGTGYDRMTPKRGHAVQVVVP